MTFRRQISKAQRKSRGVQLGKDVMENDDQERPLNLIIRAIPK